MPGCKVIDAHQHFWRIGKHDCSWPTADLADIYRDFLPKDFAPIAADAGVSGTVLVQSQESDADTDFLLALASESDLIKAVVGWVDLASGAAPARIAQLAKCEKMRGLRPMLQARKDDSWILDPALEPAVAAMIAAGMSLDALVFTRHLPYLRLFAKRHPQLPIVIDHGAKPAIAAAVDQKPGGFYEKAAFQEWADSIGALADLPQVYCKISGLVTEAGDHQGLNEIKPYIDHLYSAFGADRLMWGSDWPVLGLAKNQAFNRYDAWLLMTKELLRDLRDGEREAIFDGTARRFYRIE
jgi:L-fuconolactonase